MRSEKQVLFLRYKKVKTKENEPMTNTTKYTSTEDYLSSPNYYKEKGKLNGYNEVMKWMNEFDVMENPEVRKVANMMEMEFAVSRNRSLTPIADQLGIFISAGDDENIFISAEEVA